MEPEEGGGGATEAVEGGEEAVDEVGDEAEGPSERRPP